MKTHTNRGCSVSTFLVIYHAAYTYTKLCHPLLAFRRQACLPHIVLHSQTICQCWTDFTWNTFIIKKQESTKDHSHHTLYALCLHIFYDFNSHAKSAHTPSSDLVQHTWLTIYKHMDIWTPRNIHGPYIAWALLKVTQSPFSIHVHTQLLVYLAILELYKMCCPDSTRAFLPPFLLSHMKIHTLASILDHLCENGVEVCIMRNKLFTSTHHV